MEQEERLRNGFELLKRSRCLRMELQRLCGQGVKESLDQSATRTTSSTPQLIGRHAEVVAEVEEEVEPLASDAESMECERPCGQSLTDGPNFNTKDYDDISGHLIEIRRSSPTELLDGMQARFPLASSQTENDVESYEIGHGKRQQSSQARSVLVEVKVKESTSGTLEVKGVEEDDLAGTRTAALKGQDESAGRGDSSGANAASIHLDEKNSAGCYRKRSRGEADIREHQTVDQEQEASPGRKCKIDTSLDPNLSPTKAVLIEKRTTEGQIKSLYKQSRQGFVNSDEFIKSAATFGNDIKAVRINKKSGNPRIFKSEKHISLPGDPANDREISQNEKKGNDLLRPTGGFFEGINALFVGGGVSPKRLQVWKARIEALGGHATESVTCVEKNLTHVFSADQASLIKGCNSKYLKRLKDLCFLKFEWIEDCLKEGKILPCDIYRLQEPFKSAHSASSIITCEKLTDTDSSISEFNSSTVLPSVAIEDDEKQDGKLNEETKQIHICRDLKDFISGLTVTGEEQYEDQVHRILETSEGTSKYEPSDLNKHVTGILKEMWLIYEEVLGDEWRSLTYRKAITRIEKLPYKISSSADVKNIFGIGSSMAEKIKEILCTGRLQKLENLKADPQVQVIQKFASVWGIGPKQAQKFYQLGHRNLEDLLKDSSLSHMARTGVSYFHDISLRIPREEVEEADKYVQRVAEEICPGISIRVTGSFRRGHATCGDIDFLVTHPDGYSHRGFLVKLVRELESLGFISESLHCTDHFSEGTKHKVDTFMGICRLPQHQHHRRVDIKVYSKESYAFALVYFTGNDVLNRKIRYAAQRKGYKLNDQGLFLRVGGKNGVSSEISIPCETEEEVFNKLGFPYYEPHERNM